MASSKEIKELFGFVLAAIRPEPATDSSSHDNAIIIVFCHDAIGFKVSAKLEFIFVLATLFMINHVINTFFEEKVRKNLEVKKKVVPLHPQSRNKLVFVMPRWRNR